MCVQSNDGFTNQCMECGVLCVMLTDSIAESRCNFQFCVTSAVEILKWRFGIFCFEYYCHSCIGCIAWSST